MKTEAIHIIRSLCAIMNLHFKVKQIKNLILQLLKLRIILQTASDMTLAKYYNTVFVGVNCHK